MTPSRLTGRFALLWMVATLLALGLTMLTSIWGFIVGPVLLGVFQAGALRSRLPQAWHWAIATSLGGWLAAGVGILLTVSLGQFLPRPLLYPFVAAIAGLIIGLGQWWVLRPHLRQAHHWLFSSALALMFGASWVIPLGESEHYLTSDFLSRWQWLAVGLLSGAIGGGIKGVILWQLLQRRRSLGNANQSL